ncbi:MAG: hypothetical protein DMG13_18670 [Acidobacteria bacterium]|nr:MAG: hypothetical protein DMG13_18670 [Acidobacteriota bacterium]
MVIVQRNEVNRNRVLHLLTLLLSGVVLAGIAVTYSSRAEPVQLLLALLGFTAVLAIVLSFVQLYAYPRRSQVLLFHREDEIVVATNTLHEGFKLRFLRDVLGEHVASFSDEDRARWKSLEEDGFYAALYIRNVRKVMMLRLCTMIFDDVFVEDRHGRWEHHDSSRTAEPSFAKREMPRLKSKTNAG